mgnify:CR=1 FL=1
MKLIKFIGNAVRGYMNFNITFRDSVTFLIGINGAGKTTVLKLLSGLLTPSYLDLVQIDFTTIELHCERNSDGREIVISCDKTDDELQIRYMDSTLKVPIVNKVPYSKKNSESRKTFYKTLDIERINNNVMLFEDTQVVCKIKQLNTPLFLGLNRRITDVKSRNHEFDIYFQQVERKHLDVSFDAVDEALRDIQDMFYDSVRRNARSQISISENFRKRIFDFFDEITTKYLDENILVVTHAGVGIYARCYFEGEPLDGDYSKYKLKNGEEISDNDWNNFEKSKAYAIFTNKYIIDIAKLSIQNVFGSCNINIDNSNNLLKTLVLANYEEIIHYRRYDAYRSR